MERRLPVAVLKSCLYLYACNNFDDAPHIVVTEGGDPGQVLKAAEHCRPPKRGRHCKRTLLDRVLERGGVPAAFDATPEPSLSLVATRATSRCGCVQRKIVQLGYWTLVP